MLAGREQLRNHPHEPLPTTWRTQANLKIRQVILLALRCNSCHNKIKPEPKLQVRAARTTPGANDSLADSVLIHRFVHGLQAVQITMMAALVSLECSL